MWEIMLHLDGPTLLFCADSGAPFPVQIKSNVSAIAVAKNRKRRVLLKPVWARAPCNLKIVSSKTGIGSLELKHIGLRQKQNRPPKWNLAASSNRVHTKGVMQQHAS